MDAGLKCCYGGPVEKCGKEYCAYRDARVAAVEAQRPVLLKLYYDGKVVAEIDANSFDCPRELVGWVERQAMCLTDWSIRFEGSGQ